MAVDSKKLLSVAMECKNSLIVTVVNCKIFRAPA